MKKIGPVVVAVLFGCTCAFFLFNKVEKVTEVRTSGNAVAIQIGVFKNSDNAEKMSEAYGGVVFKDNDLYRVYYSILNKDDNIDFMTSYLSKKGINYYLKSIMVSPEALDSSKKYEALMSETNDESKLTINEELLNFYKEVV